MKRILGLLVVAALLSTACDPNGPDNGPEAVRTSRAVDVGCAIATVGSGGPGATELSAIQACGEPIPAWEGVAASGRISVNTSGEAWIRTAVNGSTCGLLYVFHNTQLTVSDAQPGSTATASVTSGSIGWANNCSGTLTIFTPSGGITITGSWVSVTYEPAFDLSVFVVFDGTAEVAPIDDPQAAVELDAGTFIYTSPDPAVAEETGVPSGEPVSVEQLPGFAVTVGLTSSFGSIANRAEKDGFALGPLQQLGAVNVRAGGGPLDDPVVQEALTFGLDWPAASRILIGDGPGAVTALFGPTPGLDLTTTRFAPGIAQQLLAEIGVEDTGVALVFLEEDAAAVDVLQIEALAPFLVLEPTPVRSDEEARNFFAELTADGRSVIWLGRS